MYFSEKQRTLHNKVFKSMENQSSPNPEPSFKSWISTSVTVKMFIIGALALILLVPANMVQLIVNEREQTGRTVEKEVAKSWADKQ